MAISPRFVVAAVVEPQLKPNQCPSLAAVKEREEKRAKTGYTGFSPEALYDAFLAETPRVGFWLDNTSLSPAQAADAILRRCAGVNG